MNDVIWGNITKVLESNILELNITHQKDGNENEFSELERIKFSEIDAFETPKSSQDCSKQELETLLNKFVKCEIEKRDSGGNLVGRVFHSGAGGY